MPYTISLIENNHVVFVRIIPPIDLEDLRELNQKLVIPLEATSHILHLLVDTAELRLQDVPPRTVTERNVPFLNHPKAGYIVICGAVPLIRGIVNAITLAVSFKKVVFFASETEALVFLRKQIALDDIRLLNNNIETLAVKVNINSVVSHNPIDTNVQQNFDKETDLEYIAEMFTLLIAQQEERSRRPPTRFKTIWEMFGEQNGEVFTLEQLTKKFPSQGAAQDALTELNRALKPFGVEIEHIPAYRFRKIKSE